MSDAHGWADPVLLASAAVYLGLVPLLAALGTYRDARRRVSAGEALLWAVSMLCAFPLGFPFYLWRAYRKPERVVEPLPVLPWVRAFLFLAGTLIVVAIAGAACAFVEALVLRFVPRSALTEGEATLLLSGLSESPVLIASAYLCRRVLDLRPANTLGTPLVRAAWPHALLGGLVGLLGPAAVLGLWAWLCPVRLGWNPDWPGAAAPLALALPLLIAAFSEEIAFRGYLQRNLAESWGPRGAVIVGSLLFAGAHGANTGAGGLGIANVFLIGLFLALTVLLTGRLWFALGFHFAWNYTLGLVLHLPVSGLELRGAIAVRADGPDWLTGGAFGPEASVATTAVAAVLGLVVWVLLRRAGQHRETEVGARTGQPEAVEQPAGDEPGEVADVRDAVVAEEPEQVAPDHRGEPEDQDERAGEQLR